MALWGEREIGEYSIINGRWSQQIKRIKLKERRRSWIWENIRKEEDIGIREWKRRRENYRIEKTIRKRNRINETKGIGEIT